MIVRAPQKLRALLACVYGAVLFYFGVIDIGQLPTVPVISTDKLLHAGCFGGLELLVEWAAAEQPRWRRMLLGIGVTVAAGGVLELVQAGLPYRSADWFDWFADAFGALVGAGFLQLLDRWLFLPTRTAS